MPTSHYPAARKASRGSLGLALVFASFYANLGFANEENNPIWHVSGDFRLRYENVEQDAPSAPKPAEALTLRSTVTLDLKPYESFSARIQGEDSRQVGIDRYNDTLGQEPQRSVIADPESSEIDQAWIRYQRGGHQFTLGRQILDRDGQRMVGGVGWRQDQQRFEAFDWSYQQGPWQARYSRISERLRPIADERDVKSKDHLFDLARETPLGKLSGYYYSLQERDNSATELNTVGIRLAGKRGPWNYLAEFADQVRDPEGAEAESDYRHLRLAYTRNSLTLSVAEEILGSKDGSAGFSTPIATLHKFNGWADLWLATPDAGLQDRYASLSYTSHGYTGTIIGHDYSSDHGSGASDLGEEWNLLIKKSLSKSLVLGGNAAAFRAGDAASGKIDVDKFWLWATYSW